jgi:hypothetical protein
MQHKKLKSTDFILPEQGLEDKTNNTKPTQCKLQWLAGCAQNLLQTRSRTKGYTIDESKKAVPHGRSNERAEQSD